MIFIQKQQLLRSGYQTWLYCYFNNISVHCSAMGGTVVQWLAPLHLSKKVLGLIPAPRAFLGGLCSMSTEDIMKQNCQWQLDNLYYLHYLQTSNDREGHDAMDFWLWCITNKSLWHFNFESYPKLLFSLSTMSPGSNWDPIWHLLNILKR